ncbi:MAG: extracellular solute-binding protein [Clostridia bacterium]|nr:extracellular solute-binding protein [Clostridia bacterium]
MKKVFCIILAMSFILPIFSGCHGKKESRSFFIPESFDETENFEITFWAKNDTNKVQTAIYEKAISDFEALYPNIKVKMKLYTDYGKIYNDVITNIATDTTPNLCITYPDHIATYMSGGDTVVPLNELMEDERFGLSGSEVKFDAPKMEEIVPEFLSECAFGDTYYALPFMRSGEALYINKDYVERLGYEIPDKITWDFIWEVSDAATEKNEDGTYKLNGQKVMIPFIYKSTDNMMIQYLKQKEAPYSEPNGEIKIFNEETKEFLKEISKHVGNGAFSTFKISSYPGNFFNAGQCIFAIDSTAGATWLGSDAPLSDIHENSIVEFETVVKMIPQVNPDEPKVISQGPSVCVFNKENPSEVLASWLFLQYLLTNEVQIAYSKTEGYVPVTKKARDDFTYTEYLSRRGEDNDTFYSVKIDASKIVLENTKYSFVTPVFNGSASLRNAAGQLIEETVKSVRRKEKVDDKYFDELFSEMESLYRLDQTGGVGGGRKKELSPLPVESKVLLISLALIWALIAAYVIWEKVKNKKKY